jgi:hypothetical protein
MEGDIRDVFACCALIGLSGQPISPEMKAKMAYEIADAMLDEREDEEDGIVAIKPKRK